MTEHEKPNHSQEQASTHAERSTKSSEAMRRASASVDEQARLREEAAQLKAKMDQEKAAEEGSDPEPDEDDHDHAEGQSSSEETPPAEPSTDNEKEGEDPEGFAGFMSELSKGIEEAMAWLKQAGKDISDAISEALGIKKEKGEEEEGVDPEADKNADADSPGVYDPADNSRDAPKSYKEYMKEIPKMTRAEMAWPDAPIWTYPAAQPGGGVSSRQGMRDDPVEKKKGKKVPKYHDGVDVRAPRGTPIALTMPGEVVFSEWNGGHGFVVGVEIDGEVHYFNHLKQLGPQVGTQLEIGDVLGYVGSTGHSTGPHLHYRVKKAGKITDPEPFLAAVLSKEEGDEDERLVA